MSVYFPNNLHYWNVYSNRKGIPSSFLFCRKKPVYEDIVIKSKEASTYQELDLSENVYQNSTMWCSTKMLFSHLNWSFKDMEKETLETCFEITLYKWARSVLKTYCLTWTIYMYIEKNDPIQNFKKYLSFQ